MVQIIHDAMFYGTTLASKFEHRLGIAPDTLAMRLSSCVDSGLLHHERTQNPKVEGPYKLTEMGLALAPSIIALSSWGDDWSSPQEPPGEFDHAGCGGVLRDVIRCESCGDFPPLEDIGVHQISGFADTNELREEFVDAALDLSPHLPQIDITVLGGFAVQIDKAPPTSLPTGAQRVLAYLALHDRSVTRISMAGTMWPDVSDHNASSSLRSALSRLDSSSSQAIRMASAGLRLADNVTVDLRSSQALAQRLLDPKMEISDADLVHDAVTSLSSDLLPGWYDDWVVSEAEDWRQLRMNGLEVQARALTDRDRWAEAAGAARAAMHAEPLRESGYATLIRIHLAQGNQSEALRVFEHYRRFLFSELGLEPSRQIVSLVKELKKF